MIEQIYNLLLFFILGLVYFYSLTGYGKILTNKYSNFFELPLDGSILLLIIGYVIYVSIGINILLNFLILFVGLILFFYQKKKISTIKFNYIFLIFFFLFSVIIISKTHEDFNLYHFFSIFELFNNSIRIGISKLNPRFLHSSHFAINQALIILPYLDFKIVHLPVFIIYLSTIGYFLTNSFSNNLKQNELLFSLSCLLILLVKFNRLSEFGYDYISQFILLIVFHKIYFLNLNKSEVTKAIIYFILCILIKPISLLFFPILLFIIYKKGFNFFKEISSSKYIVIFLLLITLFSSSFAKTGCLFYAINSSCLSNEKIFWSEKDRLKKYSKSVQLWAKSFYVQVNSEEKEISDKDLYLQNFNWFKFWVKHHFFYKIFEFLLIIFFVILLIYFYFSKTKKEFDNEKRDRQVVFFLSMLSVLFWLNTVPQLRFGFASIIIFIFFLFNFFLNLNIKFSKRKIKHLIIFGLIVLNIKNLNRINNEFNRNDFYKFTNFPYYNQKKINNDYSNLKRSEFLHIEILK